MPRRSLIARLLALGAGAQQLCNQALFREAHVILNRSRPETPVLTGRMVASGRVAPIMQGALIGFGGHSKKDVVKQHERMDYRHPRGGKAKFLADPFNAHIRGPFVPNVVGFLRGKLFA